ncbi:MAG: nucleotide sugar dehydrogenase [Chloroherpetonaceae bacterium]|nr:nucleotide sugar dehydrogenase [Chthonomonadaceae bacterium]MDW8209083.1 nucleotide sugar dehydrogenase [Chloroherpetonaceae bacterium]
MNERIAVIGLGYVGLPVALAMARHFPHVVGFDVNRSKVQALRNGIDRTGEVSTEVLLTTRLRITDDPSELEGTTFFIVAVPTPIDRNNRPDLNPLIRASETIGRVLCPNTVVVYESTVYPGVTEDICGRVLERVSGLRRGVDFKLGYSPERINPGDKEHTLEKIVKVVSAEDEATLERVAAVYEAVVEAGVHRAPSIKVAEAAKVIENTQRDLNIALMNELAMIFDRLGIRTIDVLQAAATKWNFLPFRPGLVGGHCIGVDPYYLTTKAEEVGYHPQVILAGRRINDGMGAFLAQRLVKLLINADIPVKGARVGILGLTFKENVPDLRNSRVPDIVNELRQFGIDPVVHDPVADPQEAVQEYGLTLVDWSMVRQMDGIVLAVSHQKYLELPREALWERIRPGGVLMDVKSVIDPRTVPPSIRYWSL